MNEYVNPIDNVIEELRDKRRRIVRAYNSGMFCDNKTSKHNIDVLTRGIVAMNNARILFNMDNKINK